MKNCSCGRVARPCGVCCPACETGQHTNTCHMQQLSAGAVVRILPGRQWEFDPESFPRYSRHR